ncbi:MAG: hypothetical protein ACOYD0_11830 [Candidatus Nanopelagicales bacterium]
MLVEDSSTGLISKWTNMWPDDMLDLATYAEELRNEVCYDAKHFKRIHP